jgi:hypothetical protein
LQEHSLPDNRASADGVPSAASRPASNSSSYRRAPAASLEECHALGCDNSSAVCQATNSASQSQDSSAVQGAACYKGDNEQQQDEIGVEAEAHTSTPSVPVLLILPAPVPLPSTASGAAASTIAIEKVACQEVESVAHQAASEDEVVQQQQQQEVVCSAGHLQPPANAELSVPEARLLLPAPLVLSGSTSSITAASVGQMVAMEGLHASQHEVVLEAPQQQVSWVGRVWQQK